MSAKVILLPTSDTPLTNCNESLRLFKKNLLSCVEWAEANEIILAVGGVGCEYMKSAEDFLWWKK